MDRGLYVAMTGAKQIMQAQAVNNHNIANLSTIGFRADTVAFDSEPIYGPGYATRVNAVAGDAGTDFSMGVMQNTSRDLDIAVNGKGFIAVRGTDGKEAYTRAGDLRVSPEGAVTTASGLAVLTESGPLVIPPSTQVTIGGDGTVSVVPQGSAPFAVTQVDRIKLVNPKTSDLQKGDDGLLRLKSGDKLKTDDSVSVTSGMLESSNVNAAQSLISMIELQRLYEFQIKSLNSTDQNEQSAERLMLTSCCFKEISEMNLALWAAKTGLDAQNTRMAVISNNLANTNTTGFKAGRAAFQDLMYQNIRQVGAQSTQNTQYSTGLTLGTGVRIVATEKDYTQGSVLQTNGSLDMSVNGRGFLQITMPDGTIAYTRDGSFSLDNQGNVVTASGYPLQPAINIPAGTQSVTIGNDGVVTITSATNAKGTQVGQIQLADFINEEGLQPTGNNLLVESAASGSPQVGTAGTNGLGH